MEIGLVDIDGKGKIPNLALAKIARYHKQKGDNVEWAWALKHYDVIYMSKVFNYTDDNLVAWNADKIVKGGTGYDIKSTLPTEIDRLQPDYSIYPLVDKKTAYGFLTRGCPNKCKWCVVPLKEGSIKPYMDIDEIAIEGRTNIVLFDNNILALKDYAKEQLSKIIERGYRIDFNQAMDARLITDEFAQLLAKIKWIDRRIRLGCDSESQIKYCEKAIELMDSYGYKGEYFLYTMLNDNFDETYRRTNHWYEVNQKRKANNKSRVYIHCQPFRDVNNVNKPPQWQLDMARWSNRKELFFTTPFKEYKPRQNFKCDKYLELLRN